MYTKRKYEYKNSGFPNMRDREREKAKEIEKHRNGKYKVYPWKLYGV